MATTQSCWRCIGVIVWAAVLAIGVRPPSVAAQESTPVPDGQTASDESDLPAGHSQHGEAFNEGPRQQAYLMGGTGKIHFPVTSGHPDVQAFVEQGIGQVHGYWYFEAERSFRQAATLDPDCAIAYWGMALANKNNAKRAKAFVAEAVKRREHAGDREQMFIDALHKAINTSNRRDRGKELADAYRTIVEKFPEDIEAKAFLANTLYESAGSGGRDEAERALGDVLAVEPSHPVHHYRIHLWDTNNASRALDSAAQAGPSAPRIAHMWHMPGHIYSRLKRYEDAVWQQEASARVDHANMMRDRVMPDQIHNFAHNNEWLVRSLTYVGRWRDAVDLAANMTELPRHPNYNTLAKRGSAYYGRLRLFDVLTQFEQWDRLIELAQGPHLEPSDRENDQIDRLRHLGVAYAATGQGALAEQILGELETRLAKVPGGGEASSNESSGRGGSHRRGGSGGTRQRIERAMAAIRGYSAAERGDFAAALPDLKSAGENAIVQARIQCLAGETDAALAAAAKHIASQQNRAAPLAGYVEILWLAGDREKAAQEFERLRAISGSVQFGSPVFDRLAPIAAELGMPEDWRMAGATAADLGDRPDLDTLGPIRWSPTPAPDWSLTGTEGTTRALADYRGRPLVVVFYLGYACLHCTEQLHALAPMADKFRETGVDLIAISSDDLDGLKHSLQNYDGEMPFPLVSDSQLDVFKAYRAYDHFEGAPMHATFLIDERGQVRWQDVSYEPFMNVEFLLSESQRLLAQPHAGGSDAPKGTE